LVGREILIGYNEHSWKNAMHTRSIREALRAQPFHPFVVKLVDGRQLQVRHPEFVAMSDRHLIHINEETDAITWIEPVLVLTFDFLETPPQATHNGPPPAQ